MFDFTRSTPKFRHAKLSTASGPAGSFTHPIVVKFVPVDGTILSCCEQSATVRTHDDDKRGMC
jgi:hypothetical protein